MADLGSASGVQEIQTLQSTILGSADGSKPFEIMAVVSAVPGKEHELEAVVNAIARAITENEPGAMMFKPYRSGPHPGGGVDFIVRERWVNEAAKKAHEEASYVKNGMSEAAEKGLLGGTFMAWFVTPLVEGRG